MARMCIITRKEVPKNSGTPVREDAIISAIRKIKGKLGILQNNVLVVSDGALEEHKKKRENFERMAVIHTTVAAILVVAFIFGPLLLGAPFNLVGVLLSILLGILIAGLALLSYIPALDDGKPSTVPTPGQIVKRLMPRSLSGSEPKDEAPAKPRTQKKAAKPYRKKKRK